MIGNVRGDGDPPCWRVLAEKKFDSYSPTGAWDRAVDELPTSWEVIEVAEETPPVEPLGEWPAESVIAAIRMYEDAPTLNPTRQQARRMREALGAAVTAARVVG